MKNRTIKFRVWNNKRKEWVFGPHENSSVDGVNLFGETILCGEFVSLEEVNDCVPLQFTGLKDKNGKEIYEGDIIKYTIRLHEHGDNETHIGEVYYDEEWASFFIDKSFEFTALDWAIKKESFEVIGNTCENPDLIK